MASSAYYPGRQRPNGNSLRRLSITNALPVYSFSKSSSSSAVAEKYARRHINTPWWIHVSLPLPFVPSRRLRIFLLNPRRIHQYTVTRFGRKRGSIVLALIFLAFLFTTFALAKRFGGNAKQWPTPFKGEMPTLVYKREDLQRIWQWEVASGHYPSRKEIPEQIRLKTSPANPAIPPRRAMVPSRFRRPPGPYATTSRGTGSKRIYLDIQSLPPDVAYPPRPVPGSIADLDIIMEHCDFSEKKFVRDCLEVLKVGAGLDNGNRVRRGNMNNWKYIYVEEEANSTNTTPDDDDTEAELVYPPGKLSSTDDGGDPDYGLPRRRSVDIEDAPIPLPSPLSYTPYALQSSSCDPENPRLFHMFWTGPFTDKPYLAILSFLFTQNTGLHLHDYPNSAACRPQFWLWINPGPAAAVPNPTAMHDMYAQLKANPWASPFLHPRFKDIVQFKMWNTTEQLDGVPELKDEWRSKNIFNSGGYSYTVTPKKAEGSQTPGTSPKETASATGKGGEDDLANRTGSKSSSTYDRLSVILSDMARFILVHRFGGIYLDADTIFLRDWEELWGWKGAFAYRWSRLEKYNTAVLRMNKNSALGKFLFRTALKNDLDFHPMTVSRYTKDAYLEGLLLRLPDALFDSAWLNVEDFQRSRPAQPFFTSFDQFFELPPTDTAAPQSLGFDAFFKGAFSYHFHNGWWKPFDPARNWPDLGPRFIAGERQARRVLRENALTPAAPTTGSGIPVARVDSTSKIKEIENEDETRRVDEDQETVDDDKDDLDWATVIKRTFEAYIREERPNMYGEWLRW